MSISLLHILRSPTRRVTFKDWRNLIAASNLPNEAKSIIGNVVRRTRLWRREKSDVTTELIAHFTDAIETGIPITDVIDSFGDPQIAAKLIRRGKIRNRSLAWKILRWSRRFVGLLIAFYLCLSVYYYSGKATPTIDYVAELTAPFAKVSPDQRAWPIYEKAIALISTGDGGPFAHSLDGSHWNETAAWLKNQQPLIQTVRKATALPAIGYLLNDSAPVPGNTPPRVSALLLDLLAVQNKLRAVGLLLDADAKLAAEQSDGKRCTDDIIAIWHLGQQQHREARLLVGDLVSIGILSLACDRFDRILSAHPDTFTDQQLRDLATIFGQPTTASDLLSYRGEHLLFRDMVQRAFTDDGHGDGRLAPNWIGAFITAHIGPSDLHQPLIERLAEPATLLADVHRREVLADDDRVMDLMEADLHLPLRDVDLDRELKYAQEIGTKIEQMLISILVPSLQRSQMTAERLLGQRDGLSVGIALELFHRRSGHYPTTLQELTPDLLAQIPPDRITGEAVRYRLRNNIPLVYSVGVDRVDDGGKLPSPGKAGLDRNAAAEWNHSSPHVTGDWVLYPIPRTPDENDDRSRPSCVERRQIRSPAVQVPPCPSPRTI